MKDCAACGHRLGVGRFCNNCGHPADAGAMIQASSGTEDWRTDTAERTPRRAAPSTPPTQRAPRVPPAAVTPPPPPRFPLYADELSSGGVPAGPEPHAPATVPDTTLVPAAGEDLGPDRRSRLPWVAAFLLLALLAAGGWVAWEYLREDPGSSPGTPQATDDPQSSDDGPDPVDVALQASAVAPSTAPPSEDANGELVSFDASNMLDGVPETAWRTPGDATGMELTFRLAKRTTLSSVGILNGYAKRSKDGDGRTFDWYRGNRRVDAVVWDLGNGTTVRQKLAADRAVQSVDIEPVRTRKVVVRLVQVSEPGEGRASRDFTAISEVSLVGLPPRP